MAKQTVVVIGGGAAGFFGAITAKSSQADLRVILLEKTRQLLSKVRISGGGRCNVTHSCFNPQQLVQSYPRGNKALIGPFTKFQPKDTIAWFNEQGVKLKTEADGRIFPTSDSSQTIIECFLQKANSLGIEIQNETEVSNIIKNANGTFEIQLENGEHILADSVLLATGSNTKGHRLAEKLGHKITALSPSLFTFNIQDPRIEGLAGISLPKVDLKIIDTPLYQSGPFLITHWGMSGPAVLKLSAWGARILNERGYKAVLEINWLPDLSEAQVLDFLQELKKNFPKRTLMSESLFGIPKNLWKKLVQASQIEEERILAQLSKKQERALLDQLFRARFQINGKSTYKEEFVTCGGIHLDEVNFQTMESKLCPGLYFAGEVLDIDGITGGFNFQNAWTTSWLAGQALAK